MENKVSIRWKQTPTIFRNKINKAIPLALVFDIVKDLIAIPSYPGIIKQERECALFIKSLFEEYGIVAELHEVKDGRCNVTARLKGKTGGKTLLLTGHMDTAPPSDTNRALKPVIDNDYIYGRGATDMKGQLATMICAIIAVKEMNLYLAGDVLFSAVIDKKDRSLGTTYLLEHNKNIDAAIVAEPTGFDICVTQRGLVVVDIKIEGSPTHSAISENGINAISTASKFIVYMEKCLEESIAYATHPLIGKGSFNISRISGGGLSSTVAGECVITLERRYLPDESEEEVLEELNSIIEAFLESEPKVKISYKLHKKLKNGLKRKPLNANLDSDIIKSVCLGITDMLNEKPRYNYYPSWSDAGLLEAYGKITTVIFGPGEIYSSHQENEHISMDSLVSAVYAYAWIIYKYLNKDKQHLNAMS